MLDQTEARNKCDDLLAEYGYLRGMAGEPVDEFLVRVMAAMIDRIDEVLRRVKVGF